MLKALLKRIASAPLGACLAIVSVGVTLVVAINTVSAGQVPGNAALELIAALLLAAVATSEASRPQRRDRGRRRVGTGSEDGRVNSFGGEFSSIMIDELTTLSRSRADRELR